MPTFETGDMWNEFGKPNTLFVVTTNSTIKKDGCLVMGRGLAKSVRDRLFGIDAALGKLIQAQRIPDDYGLLILDYKGKKVGAFQVKTYYAEAASPALIRKAATKLAAWAGDHPGYTVNINYPGIGCGRLPEEVVRPLLDVLPENVHIWTRG
jgi:hypothetical protein